MRFKILFHDNCFDGAASAALFSRFHQQRSPGDEIVFQGVQHGSGDPFGPNAFDGDQNVCVDFRYSQSPRLTWWFDHHVSAFQLPDDRAHFEADTSGRKFYDPTARSNTKFMARVLATKFGFDIKPYEELIHWADIIDGAQFPDAATAVKLEEPALRLMTWVENNKSNDLKWKFLAELQTRSLGDIAQNDWVTQPLAPILEKHEHNIDVIRAKGEQDSGVVFFDLLDEGIDAHNKFIAYMLFPECRYTVGLTRSATRVKVSVGYNPWAKQPREHNIAQICERYGGGGHPVVGAISLAPDQITRVREVGREIVGMLKGPATV